MFPEAGVWQKNELGGRGADEKLPPPTVDGKIANKGKLKWGVGKMIAHSSETPIVIPFCHLGMEKIMPQDLETRKTLTAVPIPGVHDVSVKFGEEIEFDDLIHAHEEKHGKIRKCNPNCSEDEAPIEEFHKHWDSTIQEKELYHKITHRIEQRLEELHSQLLMIRQKRENGQQYKSESSS